MASVHYVNLSVATATAYAQLHSAVQALALSRNVAHLHGSFASKQIKGSKHWYFAFREPDQRIRQIYVGPDTPQVQALVTQARAQAHTLTEQIRPLAKSAQALGCATVQRKHLAVISRLNDFGFFKAGGVLVGTHAFLAFANTLGLRWMGSDQTADIDLAHAGRNISVSLPTDIQAHPHAALTTMEEGFLPLVQYRGHAGSSDRHPSEPEFQVDFLTPRVADNDDPIRIERLDVALQPLRFMEFSLEGIQQATLLDNTGRAVLVNMPAPERYAVHKLLLVGERTGALKAKVSKDLAQAAALVDYFNANDPDALRAAWQDANSRGPGWRKRAEQGRRALAAWVDVSALNAQ
jgi:hypothetical protein